MIKIPCPYSGERDEIEFSYAGEAYISRPTNTADLTDEEWADYLFNRKNVKGIHFELWQHTLGSRMFIIVARNTITNEIVGSCKIGETITIDGETYTLDTEKKA